MVRIPRREIQGEEKVRTAINVPGRKIMVRTAMAFMVLPSPMAISVSLRES